MTDTTYPNDFIELKWGTLKAWRMENPALQSLIDEYNAEGEHSLSAMMQRDTDRQKELICEMIAIIGKEVYLSWDASYVSVEDAQKYVMNYGKE